MKYEKLCNEILLVIKRENIKSVFHCITRLRFMVNDKTKVNMDELEKIEGVIQVKEVGEQIQLIIGPHVKDVYEEFCEIANIEKAEIVEDDEEVEKSTEKVGIINRILDTMASIFLPNIHALIAGGMLKSFVLIFTSFGWLNGESDIAVILNLIGDAPFYFLPFLVGFTTAKRFKVREVYGLMIAAVLMYPTLINQAAGATLDYFFLTIPSNSYASTVIPTILCVIAFAYCFRLVDRFIPSNVKIVFSGFLTFLIFVPIMLGVVAPLGNYIGTGLSVVVKAIFDFSGPVGGLLVAGLSPVMVLMGVGTCLQPIQIQNFATFNYCFLLPSAFVSNIAVAGGTLGLAFKMRDKKMRSATISTGSLAIFGITEPALYGIDVKYKTALMGSIVGGAVGGALYMLLSVKCYAFTMPGIFSLAAYLGHGNNFIGIVISLVAAFISAFIYSYVMTKPIEVE